MDTTLKAKKKSGIARSLRALVDVARNTVGWRESDAKLTRDAESWWGQVAGKNQAAYSHWRHAFDDTTWYGIGRETFDLYEKLSRLADFQRPARRILEWGCGGGANAIHFAREAETFIGLDITQESLDECDKQLRKEGIHNFKPVLIDLSHPEEALEKVGEPCNLFICTYVFEAFPTQEYGNRVLRIAAQLLKPGGLALIQMKYSTGITTRSRAWGYKFGVANTTTYRLDEFWEVAEKSGFLPHAIHLVPKAALVPDERYGYFVLQRT